jgi:hypothetical protein
MHRTPLRPHGMAQLEFALSVAAIGVLIALALAALSRLQLLGNEAVRLTQASAQATASAVQMARCAEVLVPTPQGTAASIPTTPRSCP